MTTAADIALEVALRVNDATQAELTAAEYLSCVNMAMEDLSLAGWMHRQSEDTTLTFTNTIWDYNVPADFAYIKTLILADSDGTYPEGNDIPPHMWYIGVNASVPQIHFFPDLATGFLISGRAIKVIGQARFAGNLSGNNSVPVGAEGFVRERGTHYALDILSTGSDEQSLRRAKMAEQAYAKSAASLKNHPQEFRVLPGSRVVPDNTSTNAALVYDTVVTTRTRIGIQAALNGAAAYTRVVIPSGPDIVSDGVALHPVNDNVTLDFSGTRYLSPPNATIVNLIEITRGTTSAGTLLATAVVEGDGWVTLSPGGAATLGLQVDSVFHLADSNGSLCQQPNRVEHFDAANPDKVYCYDTWSEAFSLAGTIAYRWTNPILGFRLCNVRFDGNGNTGWVNAGDQTSGTRAIWAGFYADCIIENVRATRIHTNAAYRTQYGYNNKWDSPYANDCGYGITPFVPDYSDMLWRMEGSLTIRDIDSENSRGQGPRIEHCHRYNVVGGQFHGAGARGFKQNSSSYGVVVNTAIDNSGRGFHRGDATASPISGNVTISAANPGVITHDVAQAVIPYQQVIFGTSGALPTNLVAGTVYFVVDEGGNTVISPTQCHVSATSGGASIDCSAGAQSGTHFMEVPQDGSGYSFSDAAHDIIMVNSQVERCGGNGVWFGGPGEYNIKFIGLNARKNGIGFNGLNGFDVYMDTTTHDVELKDLNTDAVVADHGYNNKHWGNASGAGNSAERFAIPLCYPGWAAPAFDAHGSFGSAVGEAHFHLANAATVEVSTLYPVSVPYSAKNLYFECSSTVGGGNFRLTIAVFGRGLNETISTFLFNSSQTVAAPAGANTIGRIGFALTNLNQIQMRPYSVSISRVGADVADTNTGDMSIWQAWFD